MEEGQWRLRKTAFYEEPGYPWPPRSYSCSFCRREFRSAQALGGHVNVHRRDRARMKLSSTTQIELRQISRNPLASTALSSSPSSRVSPASTTEKGKDQILVAAPFIPDQTSRQIQMASGELKVKAQGCKRRRRDLSFPLALRFSENGESLLPPEVLADAAIPVEEIDLELRLGGSIHG